MKTRTVGAAKFKSKCIALLYEIEEGGGPITRPGLPVAVVGAVTRRGWKSPKNSWAGKARIAGDIVNGASSGLWDALRPK